MEVTFNSLIADLFSELENAIDSLEGLLGDPEVHTSYQMKFEKLKAKQKMLAETISEEKANMALATEQTLDFLQSFKAVELCKADLELSDFQQQAEEIIDNIGEVDKRIEDILAE